MNGFGKILLGAIKGGIDISVMGINAWRTGKSCPRWSGTRWTCKRRGDGTKLCVVLEEDSGLVEQVGSGT